MDFGVFETRRYSRFTGTIFADSQDGQITFRWRMGPTSGDYHVSSSVAVNSGGRVFDEINYGQFTEFAFSVVNTPSTFSINLQGEPIR